jgi:hypothetical protein
MNDLLNKLYGMIKPQDPVVAATSPMTSSQLGMLNRVLGLTTQQAQVAMEQTPEKLEQSRAMLEQYTPGQPMDPRLLEQFMNLAGFGPMGMTKAVSPLVNEFATVSSKVDDLYKQLQTGSSNPNILKEYKQLRLRRDELMKDVPPQEPQGLLDTSYKGSHVAPNAETYGATLDRLENIMPADVYTQQGKRLYGLGDRMVDSEWYIAALKAKGKPDAEITIYRAVPKNVENINSGDWVTTSKQYAKQHGERTLDGDYKILTKKVKARTLASEGYPYELGYNESVVK